MLGPKELASEQPQAALPAEAAWWSTGFAPPTCSTSAPAGADVSQLGHLCSVCCRHSIRWFSRGPWAAAAASVSEGPKSSFNSERKQMTAEEAEDGTCRGSRRSQQGSPGCPSIYYTGNKTPLKGAQKLCQTLLVMATQMKRKQPEQSGA